MAVSHWSPEAVIWFSYVFLCDLMPPTPEAGSGKLSFSNLCFGLMRLLTSARFLLPLHSCHVKPWTSSLTTCQALIGVNPGPEPYTQFETLPVSRTLEPEVLRRHNVLETGQSIEFLTKLAVKLFNFECSQMLVWKYLSSGLSMATSFTSFAAFSCPRLCPTLCTGRTSFFRKLHSHSQLHLVPILSSLRWDILRNFCTIHLGLLSCHRNENCSCLWS